MTFWKSKSFRALQKTWYQLLEKEGFIDAERLIGHDMALKQTAHKAYRGADQLGRETKEAYFNILAQKIQEADFRTEVDRLILTWHADGMKFIDICAELESLGERRHRKTVRFTIRRYEVAWGMREYSPRELNRKD